MQSTFTQLNQRSDRILADIGSLPVSSETFVELAELGQILEEQPIKPVVVARLTITRALGNLTIIEVCEGASFSEFYRVFTQIGRRRSTKVLVRTANRNEGMKPYSAPQAVPGLELLAQQWRSRPHVSQVTVRIIKKRAYRKLISARPDELGLVTTRVNLPLRSFPALRSRTH